MRSSGGRSFQRRDVVMDMARLESLRSVDLFYRDQGQERLRQKEDRIELVVVMDGEEFVKVGKLGTL